MKREYHFAKTANSPLPQTGFKAVVINVNIARPICGALFGKHHSLSHRLIAGVAVAAVGVVVAKWLGHSHSAVVSHIGDGVGYGLHALGLTPFLEWLASLYE